MIFSVRVGLLACWAGLSMSLVRFSSKCTMCIFGLLDICVFFPPVPPHVTVGHMYALGMSISHVLGKITPSKMFITRGRIT